MRSSILITLVSLAAVLSVATFLVASHNTKELSYSPKGFECLDLDSGIYFPSTTEKFYSENKCGKWLFFMFTYKRSDSTIDQQTTTCLGPNESQTIDITSFSEIVDIQEGECDIN